MGRSIIFLISTITSRPVPLKNVFSTTISTQKVMRCYEVSTRNSSNIHFPYSLNKHPHIINPQHFLVHYNEKKMLSFVPYTVAKKFNQISSFHK